MEKTSFTFAHSVLVIPEPDEQSTLIAFEVNDNSMADGTRYSYECGDIIIGRQLARHLWFEHVQEAHGDFILVHISCGPMLRKITGSNLIKGTLTLHSLHPGYCDFDVSIADIEHIYSVIKLERTVGL